MRAWRGPTLAVGVGLVAALTVEFGFRGWLAAAERPYDSASARAEISGLVEGIDRDPAAFTAEKEQQRSARNEKMSAAVSHPFWGWTFQEFDQRLNEVAADFRDDDQDTFEILVLGGSVANGIMRGAGRLASHLTPDPRFGQRPIRVLTLASGGYKQPQQVNLLTQALNMGWAPEVVINLDGFNELALSIQNGRDSGAHPLHASFFLWGPTTPIGRIDRDQLECLIDMRVAQQRARRLWDSGSRWPLTASAVLGTWALGRVRAVIADYERAYEGYTKLVARSALANTLTGPPFDPDFDAMLRLAVNAWFESSLSLHSLCAARGMLYLHVLQPTLLDPGSKPLTDSEQAKGRAVEAWSSAIREGYPILRAESERLRARGVTFFDATGVFQQTKAELYFDSCHFERPGNDLLVDALAVALLEALPADLSKLTPGY